MRDLQVIPKLVEVARMRRSQHLLTLLAVTMLAVSGCELYADDRPEDFLITGGLDAFARPPNGVVSEFEADDDTTTDHTPDQIITASGDGPVVGSGRLRTYTVATEWGTGVRADEFALIVDDILSDQRSWIAAGNVSFQRVESGGSFRVLLARPLTVDRICHPLRTLSQLSCRTTEGVNLNLTRWISGTEDFRTADGSADLETYRSYLVNHEVGHVLGHGHVSCPGSGRLAPVMMQQSKSVGACIPNGWPFPDASG